MKSLIYIVYEDVQISRSVQMFLEREGYEVRFFESSDRLYEAFTYKKCDLIIMDIDSPGSDGFVVCAKIKQLLDLPVIVLTSHESDEHYIFGITMGIDTYLTKPLSHMKLIAHIRALLIKANAIKAVARPEVLPPPAPVKTSAKVSFADTTVCRDKRSIICGNNELHLTHKEYRLLLFMIENQARAVSREELLRNIWGEKSVNIKVTDDTVKRVRKKLADVNSRLIIDTMWGFGFRLGKQEGSDINGILQYVTGGKN